MEFQFFFILFARDRDGRPSGGERKIEIFEAKDEAAAITYAKEFCNLAPPQDEFGRMFYRAFCGGTLRPRLGLTLGEPLSDPAFDKVA